MFNEEEFRHWFLPQPGIVDSFIVENNGEVTGEYIFSSLCNNSELKLEILRQSRIKVY